MSEANVNVSAKIPMDQLQRRLTPNQIKAIMDGIANVVNANKRKKAKRK